MSDDASDVDPRKSDDLYKSGAGARVVVVLLILAIAGGLGYLQWRSVHPLQAASLSQSTGGRSAGAQQSASAQPSGVQSAAAAKTEDSLQPASNAPANGSATGAMAQPDNGVSADNKSSQPLATSRPEAGASAVAPENQSMTNPKSGDTPVASAAGASAAPAQSGTPLKLSPAKSASSTDGIREGHEVVTGRGGDDLEEPVRLAESYLQGKGVPRNCDAALGILRSASDRGNPRAEIKLGALYATGNCVSPDRVAAYRYFSRAIQALPNNTWLEQSRSVLWSDMSDSERKQAMEVEK